MPHTKEISTITKWMPWGKATKAAKDQAKRVGGPQGNCKTSGPEFYQWSLTSGDPLIPLIRYVCLF